MKIEKFNTIAEGLAMIDPYYDFRVEEWSHQPIKEYYSDILIYSDKADLLELIYTMLEKWEELKELCLDY